MQAWEESLSLNAASAAQRSGFAYSRVFNHTKRYHTQLCVVYAGRRVLSAHVYVNGRGRPVFPSTLTKMKLMADALVELEA